MGLYMLGILYWLFAEIEAVLGDFKSEGGLKLEDINSLALKAISITRGSHQVIIKIVV